MIVDPQQPFDAFGAPRPSRRKHAPGPWRVEDCRQECDGEFWILAPHPEGDVSIAAVRAGCTEADEIGDNEANAHLIAAAPELLASLKAFMDDLKDGVLVRDITQDASSDWAPRMAAFVMRLNAAQTAIAKAEGRA